MAFFLLNLPRIRLPFPVSGVLFHVSLSCPVFSRETTAHGHHDRKKESAWNGTANGWFKAPRTLPLVLALLSDKGLTDGRDASRLYLELPFHNMDGGWRILNARGCFWMPRSSGLSMRVLTFPLLRSGSPYPALTDWANLCRTYGAPEGICFPCSPEMCRIS